jgi:hypothetical protein
MVWVRATVHLPRFGVGEIRFVPADDPYVKDCLSTGVLVEVPKPSQVR